jgi:integrase/recombinase XerD
MADWLEKVNDDIDEPDKADILKLIEHMQDKERSILWIVRCITALITIRKQLGKSFQKASKEDIRSLLKRMEEKGYKTATQEKFRIILKMFYKVVYGNNEYYPEQVKWFSVQVGKEKASKDAVIDMAEYLEEEEVQKLIEAAPTLQNKAFLACLYESGARPEEFLRLTSLDVKIDSKGAIFILRGKTGERRVRIIAFSKLLQQWIEVHPLKQDSCYPLWISDATNYKNEPLGIRGAEKMIREALMKSGLSNKHARLYVLRHSRATHLAKYLTEAQMCTFFGWVLGTKVVRRYVHLSGKDVDNALLAISEGGQVKPEEYKFKTQTCIRCTETLSLGMNFCSRCSLPTNLKDVYTREAEIDKENRELKEKYQEDLIKMREDMEKKFQTIFERIDNKKLVSL